MEGEPQLIHKMGGGLGSHAPFADFSSTGLGSAQGPLASAVGRGAVALKWFSREGGGSSHNQHRHVPAISDIAPP